MRYALMNHYLVDIHWLPEAFEGTEFKTLTLNQHMVPQYLENGGKFQIYKWVKLRKKDKKLIGGEGIS